jgi:urease accessory protein
MKTRFKCFAIASLVSVGLGFTPAVFAHTFGAQGAGFAGGLAHPFLGLDHTLAMLAVGLWAARLGGVALWRVPLAFLAAMAGSASLAGAFAGSANVETAIGASVLALGLLLAFAPRLPGALSLLAVALFGAFHGYAHGVEMPQAANPWAYGFGFLCATASLHGLGLLLGLSLGRARWASQVGGVTIAAAGLLILAV